MACLSGGTCPKTLRFTPRSHDVGGRNQVQYRLRKSKLFDFCGCREVAYIDQSSSVHLHCETMVAGIGHITAACSRNLVCHLIHPRLYIVNQVYRNSLLSLKKFGAPRCGCWTRRRCIFRRTFQTFFRIYIHRPVLAQCFVKRRLYFFEYCVLLA